MSPPEGGQSGYCGNFNSNASDDFRPAEPGSVPDVLLPAWNVPLGEGLEPVPEDLDLFYTSAALRALLPLPLEAAANESVTAGASSYSCSPEMLADAERACGKLEEPSLHAACLV